MALPLMWIRQAAQELVRKQTSKVSPPSVDKNTRDCLRVFLLRFSNLD